MCFVYLADSSISLKASDSGLIYISTVWFLEMHPKIKPLGDVQLLSVVVNLPTLTNTDVQQPVLCMHASLPNFFCSRSRGVLGPYAVKRVNITDKRKAVGALWLQLRNTVLILLILI